MKEEKNGSIAGVDRMKAAIEQEKRERAERCRAKIEAALKEENCTIESAVLVTARGNIPQLTIIAQ